MSSEPRGPTQALFFDDRPLVRHAARIRLTLAGAPPIEAAGETIRVGAKEGNSLVLTNPTVSRYHFEIEPRPEGHLLRDLGSTNGTYVDSYRVREIYLPRRATIRAGEVALAFEILDEAQAIPLSEENRFGAALGRSPAMRELFSMLERVSQRDTTILIEGESGTGKERLAEAIHQTSPRRNKPFVVFDCAAVPPSLIESELFGHERGAFTGATSRRIGRFEEAHGGTLFLDELGELPLDLQPKLLRALEKREVRRVGASTSIPVDVRVVAATNRPLAKAVNEGTFREDLFYRLAVFEVRLPPLRARRDDIPLLAARFYEKLGGVGELPQAYVEALQQRAWPGNVRELRNTLERAVAFGPTTGTTAAQAAANAKRALPAGIEAIVPLHLPLKEAREAWLEAFESIYVRAMLEKTGGNVSRAAELSGVSRRFLQRTLARLGLRAAEADGDDD